MPIVNGSIVLLPNELNHQGQARKCNTKLIFSSFQIVYTCQKLPEIYNLTLFAQGCKIDRLAFYNKDGFEKTFG